MKTTSVILKRYSEFIDLDSLDINYIRLEGEYRQCTFSIDYGKGSGIIVDPEKKNEMIFSGYVDALNFLYKHGWEYLTGNLNPVPKTYHILQRKEK